MPFIERHYPDFRSLREAAGRSLPRHVQDEFEAYLKCDRLEHGFLRVRCEDCHAEKLVAFSCKRRGFCPSCGAPRMTDSAALLADAVLPAKPIRQWVLSLPFALRLLLATDPAAVTQVLGTVYRTISAYVFKKARLTRASGATGAVTLKQTELKPAEREALAKTEYSVASDKVAGGDGPGKDKVMHIVVGLPAAGKSRHLVPELSANSRAIVVDSDAIAPMIPG